VKLLDRSIDRPLPVFLAAALVLVFGLWCLSEIPINRTPYIEIPFTVVSSIYHGAAPDEVEAEVTIELEDELNTIPNLRHMNSMSREGVSVLFLEFEDRTDMSDALRDVRAKADLATPRLPADADFVVVEEISFDDEPIIFFTLTGSPDLYRLRQIAEDLEPTLEAVAGVASVEVFGGYEREVRVHADPVALARHDLTLADLGRVIARQGESLPSGELSSSRSKQLIRSTGEFRSPDEIAAIRVTAGDNSLLALRDVATVELGHERLTSGAWRNDEPSVTLIVRRRADVNTLETVRRLKAAVALLRPSLPPGIRIVASSDQSEEIGQMLEQLGTSAAFGFVLVVGVLIAIFGARQALLISSVLPFSILFAFAGLYVFGMTISNIALFAVILVLGLVVDGAIVVGEAIAVERESAARPATAAKAALAQVGMPVIAADLTTIAAFVPMLLMVGVMGQFMAVMPKVVVFALVGSVFVDHFLLPAASARFGEKRGGKQRRVAPDGLPWFSPDLVRARRLYQSGLEKALTRPKAVFAGVAAAIVATVAVFATGAIDSIFLPKVDTGRFTVNYELPLGTGLEETSKVGRLLGREAESLREVESYVLTAGDTGALNADTGEGGRVGSHYGRLTVDLVDRSQRSRGSAEVIAELRELVSRYAGVRVAFEQPDEGPSTGAALDIRVKGEQLEELVAVSGAVERQVAALPGSADVRVDYDRGKPEVRVEVDRVRAATHFGIAPDEVSRALHTAFYGLEVGRMWLDGERTAIRLSAAPSYAHTLENVRSLPLRTSDAAIVPLGDLARVEPGFAHDAIFRHDTLRTITVRADTAAGVSSVALEDQARDAVAAIGLPQGVRLEFGGESEERHRSYGSLWGALKWGILLIYVVIAIQFNSLLQPLIVLMSIPLAVIGVAFGLLVTGTPFSFIAFIGIVSLTGIVVNSGIVLIDGINKKRRAGMRVEEAVRGAALQRFRPVLLTAITTIAGLLPLTLGVSEGGEFWVPLGVTIISGLLASTALTLFVVPVLYSLLQSWRIGPALERVRTRFSLPSASGSTVGGSVAAGRAVREGSGA
jgi:multidrug efflux pump subunit AcrB